MVAQVRSAKKIHFAFRVCENVGVFNFRNSCDMYCRNDTFVSEKERRSACLGKRKWRRRNWKLADWIFGEIETEFDEN